MTTIIIDPDGTEYVAVIDSSAWQMAYTGSRGILRDGYQLPDLVAAKSAGFGGLFHRIGNGEYFDESFAPVHASCGEAGLPIGAYYYAQPNSFDGSAKDSARQVWEWVQGYPLQLPMMLDLEHYNGVELDGCQMYVWVRDWLEEYSLLSDTRPIIYTGAWWWNGQQSIHGDHFKQYQTIQARYSKHPDPVPVDLSEWSSWIDWGQPPRTPEGLNPWDGWQFSDRGDARSYGWPADGGSSMDVNVVRAEVFNGWLPAPTQLPPPVMPVRYNIVTDTPTVQEISKMLGFHRTNTVRLADTRDIDGAKAASGATFTVPRPDGIHEDVVVDSYRVNVTLVLSDGGGYLNDVNGDRPLANSSTGAIESNEVTIVADSEGFINLSWHGQPTHIILDLVGYYAPVPVQEPVTVETIDVVTGLTGYTNHLGEPATAVNRRTVKVVK